MGTFKPGLSDSERADLELWQGLARQVADSLRLVLDPPPLDPAPTHFERFPKADRRWYDAQAAGLEALGFRRLRDIDGSPLIAENVWPAPIRVLLSQDGLVSAAVYELKPKVSALQWLLLTLTGNRPRTHRIVELMSYRTEGVVMTVNAVQPFQVPPGCRREVVPPPTPLPELLAAHRRQLEGLVGLERFDTFEGLDAARVQQVERQRQWRAQVGLLVEELDALLAPHGKTGVRLRPHLVAELKRRARHGA